MSDARIHADLNELVRLQHRARGFSFLPRQPIHSILAGRHASRLRGRGLNFEEIRGYLPGDDVRAMDWKVTARTREPHVRVYTEERDRPVLFLVDQRASMFFGSRRVMKSVAAAETAALGAWKVLAAGDRVGALVFDDEGIEFIKPHRSRESVRRLLAAIVEKNQRLGVDHDTPSNPAILNEALRQAVRTAKHDYLVCIISDAMGMDAETTRLVTLLSAHNDVMTLFIFDPLESELPDAGRLTISEAGRQLEVDSSDRKLRARFRGEFEDRLDRIREISRSRSIPLLPIETGRDVAEQVRGLLGSIIGQRRRKGRER